MRIIDLSMEVYRGMMTYPNVAKPAIVEMETHREMAISIGTDKFGVDSITNHCMIVTGDHIGTHIDSWGHVKPDAPRAEGIPIEYCYGDGVVLDLTHKCPGDEITVSDLEEAERQLGGYRIKPRDIVLLRTDAAKRRFERSYLTDHPGMTKEGVHHILDRGVMVMGIDAIGLIRMAKMFERQKFWKLTASGARVTTWRICATCTRYPRHSTPLSLAYCLLNGAGHRRRLCAPWRISENGVLLRRRFT
jgi:kynurenine formamidase